jgi:hypothetical protein
MNGRLALSIACFACQVEPDLTTLDAPVARARLEPSALPRAEGGSVVVAKLGSTELRHDPTLLPNAMSVRVACMSSLQGCYERSRDMDGCFESVPGCASGSEGPSSCCPEACRDEYLARRGEGRDPLSAWLAVLGGGVTCVPGYVDWVRGDHP